VDSFVSIGINKNDPEYICLDVYHTEFQTPFLEATRRFYQKESRTYLASHSVSEYLKKVEARLKEEEDRVTRYLHTSTREYLIPVLIETFLRNNLTHIVSSFEGMLEFDKDDDLRRLYALMTMVPAKDGLDPLRQQFQVFLQKLGQRSVEKLIGEDAGATAESIDPRLYADTLLRVHRRAWNIVENQFTRDIRFIEAFEKACNKFINSNAVTGASSSRTPELLVGFADVLLSKANKASEAEVEASLNDVVSILHKFLLHISNQRSIDDSVQVPRR
jgi:cullin 1